MYLTSATKFTCGIDTNNNDIKAVYNQGDMSTLSIKSPEILNKSQYLLKQAVY